MELDAERSVRLERLINELSMEVCFGATDYNNTMVYVDSVDRPGLQFVGYFNHFDYQRLQLIGNMEYGYLQNLTSEQREKCFDDLFSYEIPALIYARGLEPFAECMEMAHKYDRTILRTQEPTGDFMSTLTATLKHMLSPRITRHGVLVEVYGEGVLLMGESGIGKSENAIELLKRGHRLIADDAVEIQRLSKYTLMGSAPELIRYYMELRGIGVVDVRQLFGMSAVKDSTMIDIIINLEPWKDGYNYDRVGLDEHFSTILEVKVPTLTIPVKPGRNLAVIIEVAALNNRQKKMGYNAAEEFTKQISAHFNADQAKW